MVPAVAGTDAEKGFLIHDPSNTFCYHTEIIIPCSRNHRNTPRRTEAGRMIKYPGIVLSFCKACRNGIRYAPQACGKQIRMFFIFALSDSHRNSHREREHIQTDGEIILSDSMRRTAQNGQIRKPYRKDPSVFRSWKIIPDQIGTAEECRKSKL